MAAIIRCDLAIVGGGLSGCLFALAIKAKRPDIDLRLIERGTNLGGNHLWSFFGADVAKGDRWLVEALVAHAWPGYTISFPKHARRFAMPYYTITSERLDAHVRRKLPDGALMFGQKVLSASATTVVLDSGDRIEAGGVIDCRGATRFSDLEVGWQKFLGRELLLDEPHGQDVPMVMDATVEQIDGYRFVYTLPLGERRMFVEDTYYSDTPKLDKATLAKRIDSYAAAKGWSGSDAGGSNEVLPVRSAAAPVLREEWGALPVVIDGDFEAYWRSGGKSVAKGGARAALFHPTTGYSLPDAIRTAMLVANASDLSGAALHDLLHAHARHAWQTRGFYRMLDAMLFRAADPHERYRVLERFYTLDKGLIGRFYAGRSNFYDKARVLVGKPPVPIGRAIRAIRGSNKGAAA
jgi:lycopene beta-cyclase